jgi:hypothetical protein
MFYSEGAMMKEVKIEIFVKDAQPIGIAVCELIGKIWERRKYIRVDQEPFDLKIYNTRGFTDDIAQTTLKVVK